MHVYEPRHTVLTFEAETLCICIQSKVTEPSVVPSASSKSRQVVSSYVYISHLTIEAQLSLPQLIRRAQ